MTLVSLPSPIYWPGLSSTRSTPTLGTAVTLDAAGEYVSYVFCAREDMTVSHVGFRAGVVAGSPTCTVGIEAPDSSGFPAGSAGFGSTNATTATISSNTWVLTALGGSATITKGQVFCVKIAYASGTSVIVQHTALSAPCAIALPYSVVNTGSPTRTVMEQNIANIALGSDSTTFYQVPGAFPISAISGNTFNNTNAAKRGLRFTPPMRCRVIGLRWYGTTSFGDFNAAIYDDTTGSAVEVSNSSTAFDGEYSAVANSGNNIIFFDNAVTCSAGTTYRAAIEPTSATNVNLSTITLPSASYRGASPAGATAHYTTFVTGGWTDTATDQLPLMDIVIDQVDDGTGTGGVVGVIGG
jgi:hypothetical protein